MNRQSEEEIDKEQTNTKLLLKTHTTNIVGGVHWDQRWTLHSEHVCRKKKKKEKADEERQEAKKYNTYTLYVHLHLHKRTETVIRWRAKGKKKTIIVSARKSLQFNRLTECFISSHTHNSNVCFVVFSYLFPCFQSMISLCCTRTVVIFVMFPPHFDLLNSILFGSWLNSISCFRFNAGAMVNIFHAKYYCSWSKSQYKNFLFEISIENPLLFGWTNNYLVGS